MSTDHAYEAGRYARQAARGRDTCPRYGITPDARQEVDRWRQGWDDQDREMAGQAKRNSA
ncbi:hypothetical protein CSC62_05350 [Pseudoxanthomonas jiangsuensis]|uniref:hypothetical protein n=1 Tax=Pseudoxanthomonas jiangsuensis TaxID=619688 RepID=UPI0013913F75|nr:hypothetical protein [Pseudoxanthomonas jiangsuensis]KAF1698336.1 hypothetical protein CSC62_05350 [Pseudoxanthomonas jiangsuensis]